PDAEERAADRQGSSRAPGVAAGAGARSSTPAALPVHPAFPGGRPTMTPLESVFAAGPWLAVALVQGTLVALLGLLGSLAVRRGGPAVRGAVRLAPLAGLLIVPALAAVAPVWLPVPGLRIADLSNCGLRIADCGLPKSQATDGGLRIEQSSNPQSAIRN